MPKDNLDKLLDGDADDDAEDASESGDAASDILEAINDNDATALDLALKRFVIACRRESKKASKDEAY